ncbi:MAG: hypothetical protein K0R57_6137 [Paenibacillaceae bacterium]|jgi:hypothetical protein|nr:hypothetical protein [Paenibacillaceae bacterium]
MKKPTVFIFMFALLASIWAIAALSGTATANGTPSASYVSTDSQTQGNWLGSYGAEGYLLPFYSTALTSGRDSPLAADVAELPDYIASYTKSGATYWASTPHSDPRALQAPDGLSRKRMTVYAAPSFTFTFNAVDTDPHLFTIYTTDFASSETVSQKFQILNLSNQVLAEQVVDTINGGKYITFEVSGSFRLKGSSLISGNRTYALGFFFDPIVPQTITNLEVEAGSNRQALVSWADSAATSTGYAVLRQEEGESFFRKIAETGSGITTYQDLNLTPGKTYSYAIQNIAGKLHSQPSPAQDVTIIQYSPTTLAFLHPGAIELGEPGATTELATVLKDVYGNFLSGHTVSYELVGEYVGSYIPSEIGSAVTDASGEARLLYAPDFAGSYTVRASIEPDDILMLDGTVAETALSVANPVWDMPPVILHVTDAVSPGMLVGVNGHALKTEDWEDLSVAVEPVTGSPGAQPSNNAVELEIVQKDEMAGQFVTVRFPEEAAPGDYYLWVQNDYGWSEPFQLNAPRPKFLSEYEVFEGLSIEMSGRNLMAAEFGSGAATQVRMKNSSAQYELPLERVTPYSVLFKVEGVPLGQYDVEISSNGGVTWHGMESGQTLTVVAAGDDPLGLGVAWAKNFNWDDVFDVTGYGALGDGIANDTQAVQDAIDAAGLNGGGVVFFPEGTYNATRLFLPEGVVLMGESRELSLLVHIGNKSNFITSSGNAKIAGRNGVARLGLRAADDVIYPDVFIWFGQDWNSAVNNRQLRTASQFFVVDASIEYPVLEEVDTSAGSGRGYGLIIVADERFLFKNNRTVGWSAQYTRIIMNEYVQSIGNYIEYSEGHLPSNAYYTFVRDNEIVIRAEMDVEVHGIAVRLNSHVENNVVYYHGADLKTTYNNDGESIFAETPEGQFAMGRILGVSGDLLTLAPVQPIGETTERSGLLTLAIIEGKGLGQKRHVVLEEGTVYRLADNAWDIEPDSTSKFSLLTPNENLTIYNNTILDGQRGIWLYGNAFDAAVADNKLVNTDGIYAFSSLVHSSNRFTPAYFIQIRGNYLTGTPRPEGGHASGIISFSQRRGVNGQFYATGVYGIEVRDNYLYGSQAGVSPSTTRHQRYSGLVSSAATGASDAPVFTPNDRDNLHWIAENNQLNNLKDGVYLMSGLYGHVTKGNAFTGVLNEVYEHYGAGTSRLTSLENAFVDLRPPFWPAHSTLALTEGTSGKLLLEWDIALDSVGVTGYRIYVDDILADTASALQTSYELDTPAAAARISVTAIDAWGNESFVPLQADWE